MSPSGRGFAHDRLLCPERRTDVAIPEETRRGSTGGAGVVLRSNRLANGVLRGQTKLFGVVVPHLYNSFYSQILQGVHEECDRHGYSICSPTPVRTNPPSSSASVC
jgi:hypothetical protein